jgi:hypothetical protein
MKTLIAVIMLILISITSYAEWKVYPGIRCYGATPPTDHFKQNSKSKGKKLETKVVNNNFELFKIHKIGEEGFYSYKTSNIYTYVITDTTNLVVGELFKVTEKDYDKKRIVVNEDIVYVFTKKSLAK